jgi:hypothetical protein
MQDIFDLVPTTDLAILGIRPSEILETALLRQRPSHLVFRIRLERGWFVLKWFANESPLEPKVYNLLERHGVPTLPLYAVSPRALLIEDLENSAHWRQAVEADMRQAETGVALALWYRRLHEAGRTVLEQQETMPLALRPWIEELSEPALRAAGERLGIAEHVTWQMTIQSVETLKEKARACPQTFNYDDFAPENLALSRPPTAPRQAIVYDYDCFTIGLAASDWRNVMYSLEGDARQAFAETYGPICEIERLLDAPLSAFYGLLIASRRKERPNWAKPLLESLAGGELERAVQDALAV